MKTTTNLIHVVFVLSALLLLSTCSKPERDNPWDENSTLNPEAWAPKDLQVEKLSLTSNRLTWTYDASISIEGFRIDRKKGDESWQSVASLAKNIRSWVDENVEPNITYTYRLYAYAGNLVSNNKSLASTTAIADPTNLIINWGWISTIWILWEDKNEGEEGFRIERSYGSGSWVVIGTTTDTYFADNAFALDQEVTYRVSAFYGNYQSSYGLASVSSVIPAPTNLSIAQISTTSIKLNFEHPILDIMGFVIERCYDNSNNWVEVTNMGSLSQPPYYEYVDYSFEQHFKVQYRIYAYMEMYKSGFVEGQLDFTGAIRMNELFSRGYDPNYDWIEIYNASTMSVDLSGYKIYDSGGQIGAKPKKEFPAGTIIEAGGFFVIVVDDLDASGFGLAGYGEEVWLEDASGAIIDNVVFPGMVDGQSYGRKPDGSDNLVVFTEITRGISNNNAATLP